MNDKHLLILDILRNNPRGLYAPEIAARSNGAMTRFNVYGPLEYVVEQGLVREQQDPPQDGCRMHRTRHLLSEAGRKLLAEQPDAEPSALGAGPLAAL